MTTYFVECYWPGVSLEQLNTSLRQLAGVRCLDTVLVPADEIVLCVVEGASEEQVLAATGRAGLPSERVVECVQIGPQTEER